MDREEKTVKKAPPNGEKTERTANGRFTYGNRGGGRKEIPSDVREKLLAASPDAVKLLVDTMNDKGAELKLRLDCANRIIERVYGKPTQPIDGNLEGKIQILLSDEAKEYAQ